MRFSKLVVVGLAFAILTACNPDPVDPNAEFTISGMAFDSIGNPAASQTVYVYKVDSVFSRDSNFLQYTSVDDGVGPDATHRVTTDATGAFSLTLLGSEVNTAGGGGAAYLTVVYYDQGIEDAFLATASDWHFFSDVDPEWNVGELELWNGGTAAQSGDMITFDWSPGRPDGNTSAAGMPNFYFVWEYSSSDLLPKWAGHIFGNTATVPRAAFASGASGLEWFVTTFSQDGSQYFQHRSNLHSQDTANGVSLFDTSFPVTELVDNEGDLFAGAPTSTFVSNAATDGDVDTLYNFSGTSTVDLFIDLGGSNTFRDVLLYDLIIRNFGNAVVSAYACDAVSVGVACGTQIGASFSGDWEFVGQDAFVYLSNSSGGSAEWIRLSVEQKGGTGAVPYFDAVSEIRVVEY